MEGKHVKTSILSFLTVLALPALATQGGDDAFMARYGFGVMIFSGFLLMVVIGTLPYWMDRWSERRRRSHK